MINFLRRLYYRRVVKGFEKRLKDLHELLEQASTNISRLDERLESLEVELPRPDATIKTLTQERELWSRMYWDSYLREEEVSNGLSFILKDFDRR